MRSRGVLCDGRALHRKGANPSGLISAQTLFSFLILTPFLSPVGLRTVIRLLQFLIPNVKTYGNASSVSAEWPVYASQPVTYLSGRAQATPCLPAPAPHTNLLLTPSCSNVGFKSLPTESELVLLAGSTDPP